MTEKQFVTMIGSLATADMQQSGILASITVAQACLESGYGSTDLAERANNLFGMKQTLSGNTWTSVWDGKNTYAKQTAEQDKNGNEYYVWAHFRKYPNIQTSIRDHSLYLTQALNGNKLRYAGLAGCRDYKRAAQLIKDGGYATDVKYVSKICSLIERWNLTQYDKEVNAVGITINRDYISQRNINGTGNPCKYIIIHETDNYNKGAGAKTHAKAQYQGNFADMSVHYYCGSDGIYQAAEHTCKCWHIGREYGGNHGVKDANNNNSIGIEICVNADGNYTTARANAIKLVQYLIRTTGIPASRVIRHYDAKGKHCPRKMLDTPSLWTDFKKQISGGAATPTPEPTTPKGDAVYMFKMETVKRGETGTHVLLVQEILKARGYKGKDGKVLELDRSCGDNTAHAIKSYQADREKQSPGICGGVDGVAGEKTLRDLIAL